MVIYLPYASELSLTSSNIGYCRWRERNKNFNCDFVNFIMFIGFHTEKKKSFFALCLNLTSSKPLQLRLLFMPISAM